MDSKNIVDIIGKEIEIKRDDIIPYVYFVCSLASESQTGMFGGLSLKSDYIGGIFDRWINIIPESIIFDKCILPIVSKRIDEKHEIKVFSDFYKYDPRYVGIAPDVIGLKTDNKVVPFVKYDDTSEGKGYWVKQPDCPLIEVKSFKEKDYMISLRNQNYSGKYLVMVSVKLSIDYLLPFFNKDLFTDSNIKILNMPNDFIISNKKGLLENTKSFSFDKDNIGTLKLLSINTADDFMSISTKCFSGQSPRYFRNISERKINKKNPTVPLKKVCSLQQSGLYKINDKIFGTPTIKTLDISISDIHSLEFVGNTKDKIVILSTKDGVEINGFQLKKGIQYNIEFGILDRSNGKGIIDETTDAGSEYFMNKYAIAYLPNKAEQLINEIISAL